MTEPIDMGTYSKGDRRCETPDCITILNIYNPGPLCLHCTEQGRIWDEADTENLVDFFKVLAERATDGGIKSLGRALRRGETLQHLRGEAAEQALAPKLNGAEAA